MINKVINMVELQQKMKKLKFGTYAKNTKMKQFTLYMMWNKRKNKSSKIIYAKAFESL